MDSENAEGEPVRLDDFAIPLMMALLIVVQVVSGHALLPKRLGIALVSRRRNGPYYRAILHDWIAVTVIATVVSYLASRSAGA
ncbi:MAG: hypothetical protein KJ000_35845 [Pirellulaceae bacterium]|nr:hypothetical protein [Pirellulaceae bacterium]